MLTQVKAIETFTCETSDFAIGGTLENAFAMNDYLLISLFCFGVLAYALSYRTAKNMRVATMHQGNSGRLAALPVHFAVYGLGRTLWIPILLAILWLIFRHPIVEMALLSQLPISETQDQAFFLNDVRRALATGELPTENTDIAHWASTYQALLSKLDRIFFPGAIILALVGLLTTYRHARHGIEARRIIERWARNGMRLAASVSIGITALIFFAVIYEAGLFFGRVPVWDFLLGTQWSPQTAIRAGQAGASGTFGVLPLFAGTLLITAVALIVAVPIGLMAAIYMSEYASKPVRRIGKPTLEILAGIPTVVYGFFAIITMAPFLRDAGAVLGLDVASESALAAGLVMGIMMVPLVSSFSDDALKAVPDTLRDASLGLGATQSETIRRVLIPAALPGIISGILLAASRAIGETMIVVMAAGLSANLTINPLESVTTITVQIVALLVGDQEFGSTKTLAAFALGLTLFLFTLCLNIVALITVRKYRQVYE